MSNRHTVTLDWLWGASINISYFLQMFERRYFKFKPL